MYSTVREMSGAIVAAAGLAAASAVANDSTDALGALPLLADQVAAESGVADTGVCQRALLQARGDLVRAVSLVRAWAATLPRLGSSQASFVDMRVLRRITPGFRAPRGGQFLGASLDYAQRLLDLDGGPRPEQQPAISPNGHQATASMPGSFPRSLESLETEALVAHGEPAEPLDVTRTTGAVESHRGAFLQFLSRAETGALTALAYSAQRGFGQRQDPTLVDLRAGFLPVRMTHGRTGQEFTVGHVEATVAEVLDYRLHDGEADPRFTLGVGATLGRVERRAIASAILDAACSRARQGVPGPKAPAEDQEFLATVLDGQEASGFVEHLKLPHHVTFTSDLDRVRQVRRQGSPV
ncbi:MAG: carbon-phosphorus lyase complex subunit PhnI [Chloroflexi bacterium]|nr:carbon-phosphorus lyase complex subunit PhnI [Chloroflexota bacterium]